LTKEIDKSQMFNSATLIHFNQKLYSNILAEDSVYGDERALSNMNYGIRTGYTLKKGTKIYFLPSEWIDKLPLKIRDSTKITDRTNVYHLIRDCISIKIPSENAIPFRELIDTLCNFEHTYPNQFLLYKIMCIVAYVSRTNWRVASPPAFGKDSVVDIIRDLTNNCARIDKASPAKLDFVLKFPFILCNEIASLKKEEKDVFLQFGLSAGAKQNRYTKPTRKSQGTKEIYDISLLSLCFTYNDAKYYREKGFNSFDESFPEQFLDRFFPVKLDGFLKVGQFKRVGEVDFKKLAEDFHIDFVNILKTLQYLTENQLKPKYEINEGYVFGKGRYRWKNDFNIICGYIGHYAKDKEEYTMLTDMLYEAHKRYILEETNKEQSIFVEQEIVK